MALQIAPLIALERRRPVPNGVLFAAVLTPQLVLVGNNGTALSYALLSDFLASMTELWMGKGIEPAEKARCLPNCKLEFSKGISASIVLKAKGLTAACTVLKTAFVLASVMPHYPCCGRKSIYDISHKTGYNCMIFE